MALEEITTGMSNAAEPINDNFNEIAPYIKDSGWIKITPNSGFEHYSEDQSVHYKKVGSIVSLRGAFSNLNKIPVGESVTVGNIPLEVSPSTTDFLVVSQGSSNNKFLLTITIRGEIVVSRYGITSGIETPVRSWLNMSAIFMK